MAASIAVAAGFLAQPGPSGADVTAVSGSAFGVQGNVAFGTGAPTAFGPTPVVTLPSTGGDETSSAESITFSPYLTTGAATVSTSGTTGAGGSATSTATVNNLASGGTTATTLSSTCAASEAGLTGSTTVTGGSVPTTTSGGTTVVSASPAVGETYNGFVPGVPTEYYRVVFNEQVVTANSITVNAAHFYLGENPPATNPPLARGDIIVGQSHCDIVATAVTTTLPTGVTTTLPTGVTTTLPTGATTTLPTGVTTTLPTGVTTTLPTGATTTLPTGVTTTLPTGVTTSTILNTVPPAPGPLFGSINVSELIRQIVCPILQQLAADPFLRPFIEPFLVGFGCTA